MSKKAEAVKSLGREALDTFLTGGANFFDRMILAAVTQFGNSGDLPSLGKDSTAAAELDYLYNGLIDAGKSERTAYNRKSTTRKLMRVYPIFGEVIELARKATIAQGKKKPQVEVKSFDENVLNRLLTVASKMATEAKATKVADLPSAQAIVNAWIKKENAANPTAQIHFVVQALRKLNAKKTSGKYQTVVDAANSAAKTAGIKWEK